MLKALTLLVGTSLFFAHSSWAIDPAAFAPITGHPEYALPQKRDKPSFEYNPCKDGEVLTKAPHAIGGVSYLRGYEFGKDGNPSLDEFKSWSDQQKMDWVFSGVMQKLKSSTSPWLSAGYDVCRPGYRAGFETPIMSSIVKQVPAYDPTTNQIYYSYNGTITVLCCVPK